LTPQITRIIILQNHNQQTPIILLQLSGSLLGDAAQQCELAAILIVKNEHLPVPLDGGIFSEKSPFEGGSGECEGNLSAKMRIAGELGLEVLLNRV
jgi:hypothetical protein